MFHSPLQAAVPALISTASMLVTLGPRQQAHLSLSKTQQEGFETGTVFFPLRCGSIV